MTLTNPEELYETLDEILALTDDNAPLDFIRDETEPQFLLSMLVSANLLYLKPLDVRDDAPDENQTHEEFLASVDKGMRKFDLAKALRSYAFRIEMNAYFLARRIDVDSADIKGFKDALSKNLVPMPLEYVLIEEPSYLENPAYIVLSPEQYAVYDMFSIAAKLHSKIDGYWTETDEFFRGLKITVIDGNQGIHDA